MPDCLTCAKSTEDRDQSFAVAASKQIQNALCKHFWFGEDQYLKSTICRLCWHKIEEFHRFYCEVEELHSQQLFPLVQLLEIKQEHAQHVFAPEQLENEDLSEDDDFEWKSNDSKLDVKVAIKRPRLEKNELDAVQEYISQNLILDCDTCSKRCSTFDSLQRHSMMEHAKKATVMCCNLKFTNNYRFVEHIKFHLDPSELTCFHCPKQFGTSEELKRHARYAHGTESTVSDVEEDKPNIIKAEKREPGDGDSSEDDRNDDEDYEQDSDDDSADSNLSEDDKEDDDGNDSTPDGTKLRRRTKVTEQEMIQIQEYVSKNITLECDTCSERFTTFKNLQKHSIDVHAKPATVLCCNKKLLNRYRFDDHIRFHLNPNRFDCSECSKKCPNRESLRRHIQKAHRPAKEKLYTCQVCQKAFSTRYKLTRHTEIHDGKRSEKDDVDNEKLIAENINLECDSCQRKHESFTALQKHSMTEHKKLAFVFCCDLKFNKKPRLIDHVRFHLDPTTFQCKICLKNLPHTESLKRHMDKNHAPEESRTLKCSMCPKMFTHRKFLSTHERYHNRRWHCEICDKRFICEANLKHHHKSIHTKELNYVCHVCARIFHIYSSYRSHLETHDESAKKKPQKPRVQCPVCDAWTLKLSHHMRLHSGPRTCEICGKECKHAIALRYHMKNHETGDFNCSVCDKAFKREIGLKEHMASHTGDVLYSCDFCDRTFNSSANRAAHRKKMHPQQWLEDKLMKKAAKMAKLGEPVQSQNVN